MNEHRSMGTKPLMQQIRDGTFEASRKGNIALLANTKRALLEPERPEGLTKVEGALWDAIVGYKKDLGVLHASDSLTILAYIQATVDFLEVRRILYADGFMELNPETGNVSRHPLINALVTYDTRRMKWLMELGLTPLGRMKLRALEVTLDSELDPFEGYDA